MWVNNPCCPGFPAAGQVCVVTLISASLQHFAHGTWLPDALQLGCSVLAALSSGAVVPAGLSRTILFLSALWMLGINSNLPLCNMKFLLCPAVKLMANLCSLASSWFVSSKNLSGEGPHKGSGKGPWLTSIFFYVGCRMNSGCPREQTRALLSTEDEM